MKATTIILAFYLFFGSFLPRMDYSQLLHLADLQSHYQLHQHEAMELGTTLSMREFLYIHFIVPDEHRHAGEKNHHQELPFHSVSSSLFVFVTCVDELSTYGSGDLQDFPNLYRNVFHLSGFLSAIFHPPSI